MGHTATGCAGVTAQRSGREGLFIEPRLDIRPVEVETAVDVFGGWKSAIHPMAPAPQSHRADIERSAKRWPGHPSKLVRSGLASL
jgi:hypothetical protein